MRIVALFSSFAGFAVAIGLACGGCNTKVATILDSNNSGLGGDGDSDGGSDADASIPDCASRGGSCIPEGQTPKSLKRKADPGEAACSGTDVCWFPIPPVPEVSACSFDAECNDDPTVSALWGACFHGICVCHPSFDVQVQPSGKCGSAAPPPCTTQSGTCGSAATGCTGGSLASIPKTNATCAAAGDVCCLPDDSCAGPSIPTASGARTPLDFQCCPTADGLGVPPVCVNGWRTCAPGYVPLELGKICPSG